MFSISSNRFSDVYGFIENSCVEKQSFSAAKLTVKLGSLIQGHDSFSLPPLSSFLLFMQMSRNSRLHSRKYLS